ncbi:hypothetical protein DEO72_LG10g2855 [Vigna unguiculata]|uniref:Uncharacterized protein n=1 Tax=Vigna unguiculata TaxID=3917 RepID=A0A4D6NCM7_VIGUN|nr:hypothetical protein DEO72_LG10g2855 [Vigna unguiculata]
MDAYKLNHSWHYTPSFIYEYNYTPKVHHLTCKVLFSHFGPLHKFYMPRFHSLPLPNPSRDKSMSFLVSTLSPGGNRGAAKRCIKILDLAQIALAQP